tara:strand:+ start:7574 stop:7744 length:171 start_codon:yes stop_codon:yes gene_type:complete
MDPICARPKYRAHKDSLRGMVPPNPNPYRKNPANNIGISEIGPDTNIKETPIEDIV